MSQSKEKHRQYMKERLSNIDIAKKKNNVKINRWLDFKSQYECKICGEKDPRCISFHHEDKSLKKYDINFLRRRTEKRAEELKNCIAVCENCHRKLHRKLRKENLNISRRPHKRKNLWHNKINDLKASKGCSICNESDPIALVFHHITNKNYGISYGIRKGKSDEEIFKEIEKCIILCANCHIKTHSRDGVVC